MCLEKGVQPEKLYKGTFNVRVSPELHKSLSLFAVLSGKTLNSVVEEAIRNYVITNNNSNGRNNIESKMDSY